MNKYLIPGLILVGSILAYRTLMPTSHQKELPGWTTDLAAAKKTAASSKELYLVDFGAAWCEYCQEYRSRVFPSAEFKEATKGMILVDVDIDRSHQAAEAYGVEALPDIRIYDSKGNELSRITGYDQSALMSAITTARAKSLDSQKI